jgi:hypothetical protein
MAQKLNKGDAVKLLPELKLLELFVRRNFFSSLALREEFAALLGGKSGVVESIEDKYQFDYFYFMPNGTSDRYSIPYQSVDFSICTLLEWLNTKCLDSEVTGDKSSGFYLSLPIIKEKIAIMQSDKFKAIFNYSNFHHSLFIMPDKRVFSSGSIEIEIIAPEFTKRLVGAYTHDVEDYDNYRDQNEQYAGTTKSLCIRNALSNEYPQFGSLLNNVDLERTMRGKKTRQSAGIAATIKQVVQ